MHFAKLDPKMMKIQEIDVTNLPKLLEMIYALNLFKKFGNSITPSVVELVRSDFQNLLDISNETS